MSNLDTQKLRHSKTQALKHSDTHTLKYSNTHFMYKYLLESVEGIQWFAIVTLLLFFGTFCLAIIRTVLTKKKQIQYMANLPLED